MKRAVLLLVCAGVSGCSVARAIEDRIIGSDQRSIGAGTYLNVNSGINVLPRAGLPVEKVKEGAIEQADGDGKVIEFMTFAGEVTITTTITPTLTGESAATATQDATGGATQTPEATADIEADVAVSSGAATVEGDVETEGEPEGNPEGEPE